MQKSVTFEGIASGNGECFCWDVDFENFKKLDKFWEQEIELRKESNIFNNFPENYNLYDKFSIFPSTILNELKLLNNKKYKFTITVEETT